MGRQEICKGLLRAGTVKFGEFTYASGAKGPIYVDLRRLVSYPPEMKAVARALSAAVRKLGPVDLVLGAATAGIPLATLVSVQTGIPMCYIRKEAKGHGTQSQIEGAFEKGQRAVLLDDLITSGASKRVFLDGAREAGLVVDDVLVVLDRRSADAPGDEELGARLHSLVTLPEFLTHIRKTRAASEEDVVRAEAWLKGAPQ